MYKYEKALKLKPNSYFWEQMKKDKRQKKWKKQQKKYGFDERDTWSLDFRIVAFVYPRLKMLRKIFKRFGMKEYDPDTLADIDRILEGFAAYLKDEISPEAHDKCQEAMNLLAKVWHGLGW